MRVSVNRVRGIFWFKKDEVTGQWRKLHGEELSDFNIFNKIFREIKSSRRNWEGHVVRMGERRDVYRVKMGKPKRK
jgi:hypothetical protein